MTCTWKMAFTSYQMLLLITLKTSQFLRVMDSEFVYYSLSNTQSWHLWSVSVVPHSCPHEESLLHQRSGVNSKVPPTLIKNGITTPMVSCILCIRHRFSEGTTTPAIILSYMVHCGHKAAQPHHKTKAAPALGQLIKTHHMHIPI